MVKPPKASPVFLEVTFQDRPAGFFYGLRVTVADGGFIRLHRKSLQSQVFSDPALWRFWCWILLRANWKTSYFSREEIRPGEVAFSQIDISAEFNVSRKTVGRWLNRLEKWGQISRRKSQLCSIVTICNWKSYQLLPDTPVPTDVPTDVPHPKKVKKGKKGKTKGAAAFDPSKVPIPEKLDAPEFHDAWSLWIAHRREKGSRLTPTATSQQINKLAQMGRERAVAALRHSTSNGWTGIFEPKQPANGSNDDLDRYKSLFAQGESNAP